MHHSHLPRNGCSWVDIFQFWVPQVSEVVSMLRYLDCVTSGQHNDYSQSLIQILFITFACRGYDEGFITEERSIYFKHSPSFSRRW